MTEHIKIPDISPIVRYVANGSQTDYDFPFPIFASEDLIVQLNGATQVSGFDIIDAGVTHGGQVQFDSAPANGIIITIKRELPIERISDYLEGGDFSAASINSELDYMIAALQQVKRENDVMLRYDDSETPGETVLPARNLRAHKALGFDGDGNPIAVSLDGAMASPDFTAVGTGANTRSAHDKLSDIVSVKDFGAVGDGITDDTIAIQNALGADNVYFASCLRIARRAVIGVLDDNTNGATHYHADYVSPYWARGKQPCAEIGAHLFYKLVEG